MDDTKNLGLFARIKNYLPSAFSGGGAGSGKFFSATYLALNAVSDSITSFNFWFKIIFLHCPSAWICEWTLLTVDPNFAPLTESKLWLIFLDLLKKRKLQLKN